MKIEVLVTGAAGYIGSALCNELIKEGYSVIGVDNLSGGQREKINKEVEFYKVDLTDLTKLQEVFEKRKIKTVFHLAAYKSVTESSTDPIKYFDNIIGTINILKQVVDHEVEKLVFSSTAAVYGSPQSNLIEEDHSTRPGNFYGRTKLTCENLIKEIAEVINFKYVILRYFNVCGDAGLDYIEKDAPNVVPVLLRSIMSKKKGFVVFGTDYQTRDGSCIRDYIDLKDIVQAHIDAISCATNEILNLGTSEGISVLELIKIVEEVTSKKIEFKIGPRRKGDVACAVASNDKAKQVLNWEPRVSAKKMIEAMLSFYKNEV
jgi:UDP-glucose 4-epimerase